MPMAKCGHTKCSSCKGMGYSELAARGILMFDGGSYECSKWYGVPDPDKEKPMTKAELVKTINDLALKLDKPMVTMRPRKDYSRDYPSGIPG